MVSKKIKKFTIIGTLLFLIVVLFLTYQFWFKMPAQEQTGFRCPETYRDFEEERTDLYKFSADFMNKNPTATVSDFLNYRYTTLVKNKCQETLDYIKNSTWTFWEDNGVKTLR
ncbi:MAG: hypothetical protein NTV48_00740 [Candidatus Vogelbacteria bacterium]|nr:hypothetical protein [Candidatus Vogelbacteria bacterium]